jgi:hypothetical protein
VLSEQGGRFHLHLKARLFQLCLQLPNITHIIASRLQRLRFHLRHARILFRDLFLEINNNFLGVVQRLGGIYRLILVRFLRKMQLAKGTMQRHARCEQIRGYAERNHRKLNKLKLHLCSSAAFEALYARFKRLALLRHFKRKSVLLLQQRR